MIDRNKLKQWKVETAPFFRQSKYAGLIEDSFQITYSVSVLNA